MVLEISFRFGFLYNILYNLEKNRYIIIAIIQKLFDECLPARLDFLSTPVHLLALFLLIIENNGNLVLKMEPCFSLVVSKLTLF
jgi:hypothetical protein